MPALNKQTLVNLLIDSPLREPIKINLIDIVNNTQEADLPKVYPTIQKELEIFQKATDRRLKLAEETIKKLASDAPSSAPTPPTPPASPTPPPTPPTPQPPTPPSLEDETEDSGLQSAAPDLPPLPKPATPPPAADEAPKEETSPAPEPPKPDDSSEDADEAALKEIQKELDALKGDAVSDAGSPPASAPEPSKTE